MRRVRIFEGLAAAFGLAFIAAFIAVAAQRITYPFELEWMEGGNLQQLDRIMRGLPLYPAPSINFLPYIYPPFYLLVSTLVAFVTGVDFVAMRAVSVAASLGTIFLVFAFVRLETARASVALAAAGLYAATFPASGQFMDLARGDALFLFLTLGCAFALRFAKNGPQRGIAVTLLMAATLTKQTAVVLLAPILAWPVIADFSPENRSARAILRAAWPALAGVVGIVACSAAFYRWFGDHYFFYVLEVPSTHQVHWDRLGSVILEDIAEAVPFTALVSVAAIWHWRRERKTARVFYAALLLGAVLASFLPRIKEGGYINNMMPFYAVSAIVAGISIGELEKDKVRIAAAFCLFLQFVMQTYDPRALLPTALDRETGEQIVARLAQIEGEVLAPAQGYLAMKAGKRAFAHQMPLIDVLKHRGKVARRLKRQYRDAIRAKRFGAIVENSGEIFHFAEREILDNYEEIDPMVDRPDVFLTVTGWRVRPERMWILKP